VFLGNSVVGFEGKQLRMDVMLQALPTRLRHGLEVLADLTMIAVCVRDSIAKTIGIAEVAVRRADFCGRRLWFCDLIHSSIRCSARNCLLFWTDPSSPGNRWRGHHEVVAGHNGRHSGRGLHRLHSPG
jgi:hypothetical protein